MEFLLLLIFLFVVAAVSGAAQKADAQKLADLKKEVVEDIKKVCPPHKWFYQEVKDQEGNTHHWRIVCELCGPMKPLGGK